MKTRPFKFRGMSHMIRLTTALMDIKGQIHGKAPLTTKGSGYQVAIQELGYPQPPKGEMYDLRILAEHLADLIVQIESNLGMDTEGRMAELMKGVYDAAV